MTLGLRQFNVVSAEALPTAIHPVSVKMTEPLNDKVGEYLFYEVLKGNMDAPPQVWLEVKDKNGNPVEIKLIKKGKKE